MGLPKEYAGSHYPERQFDTDFDIYLQLAQDVVNATVDISVVPQDEPSEDSWGTFDSETAPLADKSANLVQRHLKTATTLAAYSLASEGHLQDTSTGNHKNFFAMVYELAERTDPLPKHEPTPLTPPDRQADNFVLSDALRRIPRFNEGRLILGLAGQYKSNGRNARNIARLVDEYEERRNRKYTSPEFNN